MKIEISEELFDKVFTEIVISQTQSKDVGDTETAEQIEELILELKQAYHDAKALDENNYCCMRNFMMGSCDCNKETK